MSASQEYNYKPMSVKNKIKILPIPKQISIVIDSIYFKIKRAIFVYIGLLYIYNHSIRGTIVRSVYNCDRNYLYFIVDIL